MKTSKIYCLKDPRDSSIKYIGNTSREIYDRLKVHVFQSKSAKKPSKKEAWIKELLQLKLKPIAELIEQVDSSICVEREKYWISFYDGLTNSSTGGISGYTGCKHSEETKQIQRELMQNSPLYKRGIGQKWTEEQKAKRRLTPAWNKGISGMFTHTEKWKKEASIRMSGDNHPLKKLSDQQIVEIRNRYNSGESIKSINKDYPINSSHLNKIVNNKTRIQ